VSFSKRRLAEDMVPPMHPDRWWACAVGGVPLQSTAKSTVANPNVVRRSRLTFLAVLGLHPKTLFEMPLALSLNSGSFPSNSNVSATFSF